MTKKSIDDELSAYNDFGEAFDLEDDPLRTFEEKMKSIAKDPIEIYKSTKIGNQNISEDQIVFKKGVLDYWVGHMEDYDRHAACPNANHVGDLIDRECAKNITSSWIKKKLNVISNMFSYWDDHPNMPHGTGKADGYNPIEAALEFKEQEINLKPSDRIKPQHRITIEEIGHRLRRIKNILHRAVITTQFKFGLRAGQLSNLQIEEIFIDHEEISDLYPEMGTHPMITEFEEDVIYYIPTTERPGGKSQRPIVMPIDREVRHLLIRYLRQRPTVQEPWLFVNNSSGNQLSTDYIRRKMWHKAFHPEYSETEKYAAVGSHYGRHRFVTYWRKEVDIPEELVNYMRGDKNTKTNLESSHSMENYIHRYYQDIKDVYLSDIYRFDLY